MTAGTQVTTAPAGGSGLIAPDSVDDIFDQPGSIRAMAVLRIVLGPVVIAHLRPFLVDTASGVTYRDHFFEPWFSFLPEMPGGVQIILVWVGAVAAISMGLGWHTRLASVTTFACVAGNMFLSQTYFRHNRSFLILLLAAVALSESGKILSLDARRLRRHDPDLKQAKTGHDHATLWPLWTLRALVTSVYLASGISKLTDPDWVGGLVLWDRAVRYQHAVEDRLPGPVADVVVDIVTARWVHTITSPVAVAMELFIGIGLWSGRTRIAAVWVAVVFHLAIEVSASVEVFSIAAIAALVIWVTPRTRDRTVVVADGRWIRRLDVLARFDVVDEADAALSVTDRDGRQLHSADARAFLYTRLPATFFFAAPWAAMRRIRRRLHWRRA